MYRCLLAFLAVATVILAQDTCLYDKCPTFEPGKHYVHLVCHTHDDMGWLKTVDQYYWGANNSIQNAGVQYILNTVIHSLKEDPKRRFTYVEDGFFNKWWREQDDFTRHSVQNLVRTGQLEFANGGWVSHDEACPHYMGMIDQMTVGHKHLNTSFGKCGKPVTGWQVDPFGHSRESANLYAQMGFDAMFFARLHWLDRKKRQTERNMQFVWKGSDDSTNGDLFTGIFPYDTYYPLSGFCFDQYCDDVMVDRKDSSAFNEEFKIFEFLRNVNEEAAFYQTNHTMLTMGGDFQYQNANHWFVNLDKLVTAVNEGSSTGKHNVTVLYSTPSCFVKALHDSGLTWSTKNDDFFPYADADHVYWTGYFSSRPTLKGYIRDANNLLQVCKQFDAITDLGPSDLGDLDVLREAMAVAQHHDAVSGTAKQHVTNDYAKQISKGIAECQQVLNDGLSKLASSSTKETFCPKLNVSVCDISTSEKTFTVRAFNGMSRTRAVTLRVPVSKGTYAVKDSDGNSVNTDFKKVSPTTQMSYEHSSPYELAIPTILPPLGYNTYTVTQTSDAMPRRRRHARRERANGVSLENEFLVAAFDESGKLVTLRDKTTGTTARVQQDLRYYIPSIVNSAISHASGAYIFRPNSSETVQIKDKATIRTVQGNSVQEVWQKFTNWATQVIRLERGRPYLEIEWTIGPIPLETEKSGSTYGKEVISRIDTSIESGDTFYTDANGRQLMKRRRNFQSTYKVDNAEPVAENYYPVNTRIAIKDSNKQLTVLTDRTQGGSSMKSGSVELMLHRRLTADDEKGVNEALNETGPNGKGLVARGVHRLLFSDLTRAANLHRTQAEELFNKPVLLFSSQQNAAPAKLTGLTRDLPPNVKIITLEQWHANSILLRLEHTYQKGEDPIGSKPALVDLQGLFAHFDVLDGKETTLTANLGIDERQRFTWRTSEGRDSPMPVDPIADFKVTLQPMQIRTLVLNVKRKGER